MMVKNKPALILDKLISFDINYRICSIDFGCNQCRVYDKCHYSDSSWMLCPMIEIRLFVYREFPAQIHVLENIICVL